MKTMPTAKPTSLALARSTALTLAAADAAIGTSCLTAGREWRRNLARGCSDQTVGPTSEADFDARIDHLRKRIDD
jgi:hypothetical protein